MGHQFVIPDLLQNLRLTSEKITSAQSLHLFRLASHSEEGMLLLNQVLLFSPGFELFNCIDWFRCSKACLLKATCSRH